MFVMIYFSGDYFLFDLIFIKKKLTKLKILKKTKLVQTDRFRFGSAFRTKTGFFQFGSVFSDFARFFQF